MTNTEQNIDTLRERELNRLADKYDDWGDEMHDDGNIVDNDLGVVEFRGFEFTYREWQERRKLRIEAGLIDVDQEPKIKFFTEHYKELSEDQVTDLQKLYSDPKEPETTEDKQTDFGPNGKDSLDDYLEIDGQYRGFCGGYQAAAKRYSPEWIDIEHIKGDEGRVVVFTPDQSDEFTYREMPANMVRQVARDGTHFQVMRPPEEQSK